MFEGLEKPRPPQFDASEVPIECTKRCEFHSHVSLRSHTFELFLLKSFYIVANVTRQLHSHHARSSVGQGICICSTLISFNVLILRVQAAQKVVLRNDIPVPEPGEGQVLVRIKAASLCHSDLMQYVFEN